MKLGQGLRGIKLDQLEELDRRGCLDCGPDHPNFFFSLGKLTPLRRTLDITLSVGANDP